VIGGLAAGPSAASKAVRTNPNADVIMFEAGETVSYGICETPYAAAGIVQEEERLVIYTPEKLSAEKGFGVRILHRAEKIVPSRHKIIVRDIGNHSVSEYEYDKLIVATGATPRRLNMEGEEARNVFHLRSREDALGILGFLKSGSPKSAVIIGGGYIGIEMSEALSMRGLEVTILHRRRLPMSHLEQESRERILEELLKRSVHFAGDTRVEAMLQKSGKVTHVMTDRGSFEADIVLVCTGVEPNVELAKAAGIRIGRTGAISTDERQQTNLDGIYAAGDCCEVKNIVTGKPIYLPLATVASRTAYVAGENAAGGRALFKGAVRASALKVFEMEVAQVGISSEEARASGFQVVTELITASSKPDVMPESGKISIKLVIDSRSKQLLGANLYGSQGAVLRGNVLAAAIGQRMTVDDISRLDMIYAPPFAPLWDPILIAANQAKKKL